MFGSSGMRQERCPCSTGNVLRQGLGAEHKREWWRWTYDLASRAAGLGISQNVKDC
jgi:hypothetical protein